MAIHCLKLGDALCFPRRLSVHGVRMDRSQPPLEHHGVRINIAAWDIVFLNFGQKFPSLPKMSENLEISLPKKVIGFELLRSFKTTFFFSFF